MLFYFNPKRKTEKRKGSRKGSGFETKKKKKRKRRKKKKHLAGFEPPALRPEDLSFSAPHTIRPPAHGRVTSFPAYTNLTDKLVIRDSQVLAKLVVVTIFFIGWGQTARLQRVRQNTADRIQTETEQQQTARLQRVRQNTADRILKFDKRYKAFEIAGYFQKHRQIIG